MKETPFHFERVVNNLNQVKRELPPLLANQAQNYFVSSWSKQGFNGQPWQEVKRREEGTTEYKYPKMYGLSRRTNPILIGGGQIKGSAGGALRRATGNSIRSATFDLIRLLIDTPYAGYINQGTNKMPKRQFVGQTQELSDVQVKKVNEFVDKIWLNNK